jgi:putative membrane protein
MSNPSLSFLLTVALALGGAAFQLSASDATPTVDKADQEFVEQASQGGLFEVRSSELATKRSIGGQEQQFALMMIDDHGKANRTLASLAAKKNIEVGSTPDQKHEGLLEKLGSAADKDFAKVYVAMQLKAHKNAVDLFTTESKDGKDVDLRSFASDTLPTLQVHLAQIKAISDKY